jgi:hypothetical protein
MAFHSLRVKSTGETKGGTTFQPGDRGNTNTNASPNTKTKNKLSKDYHENQLLNDLKVQIITRRGKSEIE